MELQRVLDSIKERLNVLISSLYEKDEPSLAGETKAAQLIVEAIEQQIHIKGDE